MTTTATNCSVLLVIRALISMVGARGSYPPTTAGPSDWPFTDPSTTPKPTKSPSNSPSTAISTSSTTSNAATQTPCGVATTPFQGAAGEGCQMICTTQCRDKSFDFRKLGTGKQLQIHCTEQHSCINMNIQCAFEECILTGEADKTFKNVDFDGSSSKRVVLNLKGQRTMDGYVHVRCPPAEGSCVTVIHDGAEMSNMVKYYVSGDLNKYQALNRYLLFYCHNGQAPSQSRPFLVTSGWSGTIFESEISSRCLPLEDYRSTLDTESPTNSPSTASPATASPTASPSKSPSTASPSASPSSSPSTASPTASPSTASPSASPSTASPTASPSGSPSTASPTASPSGSPSTASPTASPSGSPSTASPTASPSGSPSTASPTASPSGSPSTASPTVSPSGSPSTTSPTASPSGSPSTASPTASPSKSPSPAFPLISPDDETSVSAPASTLVVVTEKHGMLKIATGYAEFQQAARDRGLSENELAEKLMDGIITVVGVEIRIQGVTSGSTIIDYLLNVSSEAEANLLESAVTNLTAAVQRSDVEIPIENAEPFKFEILSNEIINVTVAETVIFAPQTPNEGEVDDDSSPAVFLGLDRTSLIITGVVVGGLLLAVVGFVIWYLIKKSKKKRDDDWQEANEDDWSESDDDTWKESDYDTWSESNGNNWSESSDDTWSDDSFSVDGSIVHRNVVELK